MVKLLLDTNIIIDYLNGDSRAKQFFDREPKPAISIITYMETMIGANETLKDTTRAFLKSLEIVQINEEIAELAVSLRQSHRLKLPDAIILASAQFLGATLVTRNTKDFGEGGIGVIVPYGV
jgi:predicted nucleic acid-binding protein